MLLQTNSDLFSEKYQFIAENLAEKGWCCVQNLFDAPKLMSLAEETLRQWEQKKFRCAGVGPRTNLRFRPEIRSDFVCWLDPFQLTEAQNYYWSQLEQIRLVLNKNLFLGLFEFEGHLTLYPPGSYYRKHLDQFNYAKQRTVSSILYLNTDWTEKDGGQLRMYFPDPLEHQELDIFPHFGTQVFFLSHQFYHEVLPATRNRLSLTGWFRTRD